MVKVMMCELDLNEAIWKKKKKQVRVKKKKIRWRAGLGPWAVVFRPVSDPKLGEGGALVPARHTVGVKCMFRQMSCSAKIREAGGESRRFPACAAALWVHGGRRGGSRVSGPAPRAPQPASAATLP